METINIPRVYILTIQRAIYHIELYAKLEDPESKRLYINNIALIKAITRRLIELG